MSAPVSRKRRPDFGAVGGVLVAMAGILGGLVLERGQLQDVTQFTAALVVFGGTLGAVMVSTPLPLLLRALRRGREVFMRETDSNAAAIETVVRLATAARRNGIVSLEDEVLKLPNPFLRKGLNMAVDGIDTHEIRRIMELDLRLLEDRAIEEAHVYEAAGGYSPTIGIIGAVMGLIQVMKHLENISEVGKGIAVAFVATVYGVGLANLLLLPAGARIRARASADATHCELLLEGMIAIAEGLNPKLIRNKLEAFLEHPPTPPPPRPPQPGPVQEKAA